MTHAAKKPGRPEAHTAEEKARWQEENREAILACNTWVEKHGLPLAKYRMF